MLQSEPGVRWLSHPGGGAPIPFIPLSPPELAEARGCRAGLCPPRQGISFLGANGCLGAGRKERCLPLRQEQGQWGNQEVLGKSISYFLQSKGAWLQEHSFLSAAALFDGRYLPRKTFLSALNSLQAFSPWPSPCLPSSGGSGPTCLGI